MKPRAAIFQRRGRDSAVEARFRRDRARPQHGQTGTDARGGRAPTAGGRANGIATGILFGNERAGLTNDEVALADCIITVPTGSGFSSLNLGQAVLLIGYEWFKAGDATPAEHIDHGMAQPAPREELFRLFEHLETGIGKERFLYPPGNRPGMIRNLRSILHRAQLTDQEVRTLTGRDRGADQGKAAPGPPELDQPGVRFDRDSPWL